MSKFKQKPVEIEAMLWQGGDYDVLNRFCGLNWGRADAHGVYWTADDDKEQVVVWNTAESQWIQVPKGHWLIRGVNGELYPCDPVIFEKTYDKVEG